MKLLNIKIIICLTVFLLSGCINENISSENTITSNLSKSSSIVDNTSQQVVSSEISSTSKIISSSVSNNKVSYASNGKPDSAVSSQHSSSSSLNETYEEEALCVSHEDALVWLENSTNIKFPESTQIKVGSNFYFNSSNARSDILLTINNKSFDDFLTLFNDDILFREKPFSKNNTTYALRSVQKENAFCKHFRKNDVGKGRSLSIYIVKNPKQDYFYVGIEGNLPNNSTIYKLPDYALNAEGFNIPFGSYYVANMQTGESITVYISSSSNRFVEFKPTK